MLGQIFYSAAHKGVQFISNNKVYHLCNGTVLARTAYTGLSAIWPSGAYGSNSVSIVLPDLSAGFYLRGADLGVGVDPNVSSRYTSSGISPSGSSIGSFQIASLKAHIHSSGTQPTAPGGSMFTDKGGPFGSSPRPTREPVTIASGTTLASGVANSFLLPFLGAYPYIIVSGTL